MRPISVCKTTISLVLSVLICISSGGYAEIYKTVDKKGKVTFSDKPDPAADKVEVREPNTLKSVDVPVRPAAEPDIEPDTYTVSITHPQDDGIIANGLVPFTVSTTVKPALRAGHKLQLSIDGSVHSTSQGSFTVNGIKRGPHSLQVAVIDNDNKVIQQSATVKIFAYRPGQ